MRGRCFLLIAAASLGVIPLQTVSTFLLGKASGAVALTGLVISSEEGPMEGVLVSAKRSGSTVTITVVSDQRGRFKFPRSKLDPGKYSLNVRAVGYDLDVLAAAEVTPRKTVNVDLRLRKTQDLASQLTNVEWLLSMPGTDEQKGFFSNCMLCHSLQRILKSHHNADEWMAVFARMSSYASSSNPLHIQKRIDPTNGFGSPERLRKQAEYMSSINLSATDQWTYPLKTLPRPTGRATHVIVTEYSLPRPEGMPHDAIVDSKGMVWYSEYGEQYLGRLDPQTSEALEYPVPELKSGVPLGILDVDADNEGYIWISMMFQGAVGRFDPKTEKFTTWSLVNESSEIPEIAFLTPVHDDVDGRVWTNDSGRAVLHRIDISSGRIETFDPYQALRKGPRESAQGNTIYGVVSDSHNNAYFMDFGGEYVGRIDAKTGRTTLFRTPTPNSGPRRGRLDSQDRLWFGEFRANRIAMFDPRTEQFKEWVAPTPWNLPYDVFPDKNGKVWAAGITSDRVLQLDPQTGQMTQYLLPRHTAIRRVFVDNSTTPVSFWAGNNHEASIIKVEALE